MWGKLGLTGFKMGKLGLTGFKVGKLGLIGFNVGQIGRDWFQCGTNWGLTDFDSFLAVNGKSR